MAIILNDLEAVVLAPLRPILPLADGRPELSDAGTIWQDKLAAAEDLLRPALRATARIDTPGAPYPYAGTAFVVAPHLAVTTNFVGDALLSRAKTLPAGEPLAMLDFGAEPPSQDLRIAVQRVEMVHPHWGAAFLVLDEAAPADRIATLSATGGPDPLAGRTICVIGYPTVDLRNAEDVVSRLLGNMGGTKRVMPGLVSGLRVMEGVENAAMICHDASTLGGASGAPLIDLEDGKVLGLHHSGRFLEANYAAPAWELNRDPQWAELWSGAVERPTARSGARDPIFSHSVILGLVDTLATHGLSDAASIELLLAGLPPEMVAALPTAPNPTARLTLCLSELNRWRYLVGGFQPIRYVLVNARAVRSYDPGLTQALDPLIAEVDSKAHGLPDARN